MKRILFVDDESKVLQGLRRMLRSLRREWDMEFAEGGPEALDRLAASPFDVVVTDMRMPGMDGSQLLDEVMKLYPATVRIILSGQCDRRAVLKCVGPAHQFLTKPCDSETLKSTVARACSLRDHLRDESRRRAISRVTSIPSQPSIYTEVVAELESPQASIQRVAEIMSRDVGMTAKTLQLVSSSFFGTPQRVSKPLQAVNLLGLDTIKSLAFSTDTFFPFDTDDEEGRSLEQLIDHSRAVGMTAKSIAEGETKDGVLVDNAFLAGFLHDVGILALAQPSLANSERLPLWEAEKMSFGETHAEAGAYLMALWGLPDPIVKAIAFHHSPGQSSDQSFTATTAVHVANALLEAETFESLGYAGPIDVDYLKRIGCFDRLDRWRDMCQAVRPEGVSQ